MYHSNPFNKVIHLLKKIVMGFLMSKEEDEVLEILNSLVSYWDGLKSREFWKEFGVNGAFAALPIATTNLVIAAYFIFNIEINPDKKLLLLLLLPIWSAFGIYSFHTKLRLYQLNRQLKIIQLAQKEQEK